MPVYLYVCGACKAQKDELAMADEPVDCVCGALMSRRFSPTSGLQTSMARRMFLSTEGSDANTDWLEQNEKSIDKKFKTGEYKVETAAAVKAKHKEKRSID